MKTKWSTKGQVNPGGRSSRAVPLPVPRESQTLAAQSIGQTPSPPPDSSQWQDGPFVLRRTESIVGDDRWEHRATGRRAKHGHVEKRAISEELGAINERKIVKVTGVYIAPLCKAYSMCFFPAGYVERSAENLQPGLPTRSTLVFH